MTSTTEEKIQELIKKYQERIQILEEYNKPEDMPKHLKPLAISISGWVSGLKLTIEDLEELLK